MQKYKNTIWFFLSKSIALHSFISHVKNKTSLLLLSLFRDIWSLGNENTSLFYLFYLPIHIIILPITNLTSKIEVVLVNVHKQALWSGCQLTSRVFENQVAIETIYSCCKMLLLVIWWTIYIIEQPLTH